MTTSYGHATMSSSSVSVSASEMEEAWSVLRLAESLLERVGAQMGSELKAPSNPMPADEDQPVAEVETA